MTAWQTIDTAPTDGTVIDLWIAVDGGRSYRVADAYYETDHTDFDTQISRDGWCAPNKGHDGADDFCDNPGEGIRATHWMPIPDGPLDAAELPPQF